MSDNVVYDQAWWDELDGYIEHFEQSDARSG
jgi:hypothetical protein